MQTRRGFVKMGLGLGVTALGIGCLSGLSGCFPQKRMIALDGDITDATIGVARTSYVKDRSCVYYLSRDLEILGRAYIDKPYLGSPEQDSCLAGEELILAQAKNRRFLPSGNRIHCLNVTTQQLTTYEAENPHYIAASDTDLFSVESFVDEPGSSTSILTTQEKSTGSAITYKLAKEYVTNMLWTCGSLWVVGNPHNETYPREFTMHEFSESLSQLSDVIIGLPEDVDASVQGFQINNMCPHDGYLYLTSNAAKAGSQRITWSRICRINLATLDYSWIQLGMQMTRTQTLCFGDERLYALQGSGEADLSGPAQVCMYAENMQLIASSEHLDTNPRQMVLAAGRIFVNGQNEVFALDAATLELVARINVDPESECENNVGLFAMPE